LDMELDISNTDSRRKLRPTWTQTQREITTMLREVTNIMIMNQQKRMSLPVRATIMMAMGVAVT